MTNSAFSPARRLFGATLIALAVPVCAAAAPGSVPPDPATGRALPAMTAPPVIRVQSIKTNGFGLNSDCDCSFTPATPATPELRARHDPTGPIDLTNPNTTGIVTLISTINVTCGPNVDARYRLDCLRISYIELARSMPATGDYLPVREALLTAADQLDRIIAGNLDPAAPTIRPREGGRDRAPRLAPVRAVAPDRIAAANAAAADIVSEASLLILRSGKDPKRRSAHYIEIAAAVDNNVILLRSS